MVCPFAVAYDTKLRVRRAFLQWQQRCALDGYFLCGDRLHPFHGTLIPVFPYLGELLRVVDAEDVIDGNVDDHHQHELVTLRASCGKDFVAVVTLGQIAAHFGDGPVLAHFDDGLVLPDKRIQYVTVDTCVVI